jgi:hypothetical protein
MHAWTICAHAHTGRGARFLCGRRLGGLLVRARESLYEVPHHEHLAPAHTDLELLYHQRVLGYTDLRLLIGFCVLVNEYLCTIRQTHVVWMAHLLCRSGADAGLRIDMRAITRVCSPTYESAHLFLYLMKCLLYRAAGG